MIEKVNPSHPDKVADRIAGALVDYAYTLQENPKVAFEVLVGHGLATIIAETSVELHSAAVESIVHRLVPGDVQVNYLEVPQDPELASNQAETVKAGDNGIFKGVPISREVRELSDIARKIYLIDAHNYIKYAKRLEQKQTYARIIENSRLPRKVQHNGQVFKLKYADIDDGVYLSYVDDTVKTGKKGRVLMHYEESTLRDCITKAWRKLATEAVKVDNGKA
jgi:hypothetical protein